MDVDPRQPAPAVAIPAVADRPSIGATDSASGAGLGTWLKAIRVKQWAKNFFVLAPFLTSPRFGANEYLLRSVTGVVLFGLMASAVYLFNDIVDAPADRKHPTKRLRPVASGRISRLKAGAVAAAFLVVGLGGGAAMNRGFLLMLAAYGANNLLYTTYVKRKTVLDAISIATGFVLRVYAGGYLVDIVVTNWLVACVFGLSLLMAFGKRRAEYEHLQAGAQQTRKVHQSYTIPKLDLLVAISASLTIMTYMLYTMAPDTQALHHTDKLIFTTPFVVYCIYRFILKMQEPGWGEPFELLLKDRGFVLGGLLWLVSMLYLAH